MRIKLDKEREKLKYLDNKLAAMEKYKDQIDASNAALNKTNMLLIKTWHIFCTPHWGQEMHIGVHS